MSLETAQPIRHSVLLIENLKSLISRFAIIANRFDVEVKLYSPDALERLATLNELAVADIYKYFAAYVGFCEHAIKNDINLKNSKLFLSATLAKLDLKVDDQFINSISESDLVEMYDLNHRQIFRNFRFYEITSYSLSDLLTFDWSELYSRSSAITESLFKIVGQVVAEKSLATLLPMDVSPHLIKEIRANPVQACGVTFKFMAPVFDNQGQISGYVANCDARSLGSEISQAVDFI